MTTIVWRDLRAAALEESWWLRRLARARHGTRYAYCRLECRCEVCVTEFRHRENVRARRWRVAHREHKVPCVMCDQWFPTEFSRNCHEGKMHP